MAVLRHLRISAAFAFLFFILALGGDELVGMMRREKMENEEMRQRENDEWVLLSRRRLSGPGSSPPTCRERCGRCFPCRPVHVAIQPGRSIPLEYYPEAWRCKCGNKLFMP
ncbi:EPIDERMAL PATTERNING FACTOR-like protein 4 [Dioscorea cayenensis subsp. rotundata]|uniref:Epidermal patterning factor-like protein n=1 Tax=Dioscorea cayennensis subsp. rotundata TaxID=55577 RepID=A0AB40AIP6_DIOCR|nr:EPIDERMAL PATTERNING FACTOR-like protein 4 [Dioscorea cayenensis subsp. rotundata]